MVRAGDLLNGSAKQFCLKAFGKEYLTSSHFGALAFACSSQPLDANCSMNQRNMLDQFHVLVLKGGSTFSLLTFTMIKDVRISVL